MKRAYGHIVTSTLRLILAGVIACGLMPLPAYAQGPSDWKDGDGTPVQIGVESEDAFDDGEAARKAEEDQRAADAVIALIDALPEPAYATSADVEAAHAAQEAYNTLTYDQQVLVGNERFTKLSDVAIAAEAAAQKETEDLDAANAVAALIAQLPELANATSADVNAAQAAQEAYDALTSDQQALLDAALVDKLSQVASAAQAALQAEIEAAEEAARKAAEDQQAADAVAVLIDALPSPSSATGADVEGVQAAQGAYDALTSDQQALLDGSYLTKLSEVAAAAEQALQAEKQAAEEAARKAEEDKQAADAVVALIDSLPDPADATGDDLEAATAAQEALDGLTDDQRKLVDSEHLTKLSQVVAAAQAQQGSEHSEDGGGYYVKRLLLKWDKLDDDGVTHFVGDAPIVERAYRQIQIQNFGETVQLNGYYLSTDDTGVAYQTADSSTAIGSFNLTWISSDDTVATVSPSGLVTPHGVNGTVVITATVADPRVYRDAVPQASVTIVFDGQEGKYVESVEILDEEGNSIGENWGGVTVYDEENEFHQLHARVTWRNVVDGTQTVETTGSGDVYDPQGVDSTVIWNISTSSAFTINEETGRLRCGSYSGNAYVTCSVVGGLGGALVGDTANVQLDTGVYEYNPANSLVLKVVWEERPDEVVKEVEYSYEELLDLLPSRHVDATVVSDQRFGVISADGFLFKDVVSLAAVDDLDVLQYRFSTADGYDNPVSYSYLFSGPRYYFPNYELNGSRAGGVIVPPLLAYQSSFEWNRSEANPNVALDEGMRFRLVFGCLASGDANTSFQIYYIHGITIVLKGAPSSGGNGGKDEKTESEKSPSGKPAKTSGTTDSKPESSDPGSEKPEADPNPEAKPEEPEKEKPKTQKKPDNAKQKSGERKSGSERGGAASARHNGNGTGATSSGGVGQGADVDNVVVGGNGTGSPGDVGDSADSDTSESDSAEAAPLVQSETADGMDVGSAKRWRVYQMMNMTNSDVPDWDDENPISPFALPAVVGTFAVGVGATGASFRRRLK